MVGAKTEDKGAWSSYEFLLFLCWVWLNLRRHSLHYLLDYRLSLLQLLLYYRLCLLHYWRGLNLSSLVLDHLEYVLLLYLHLGLLLRNSLGNWLVSISKGHPLLVLNLLSKFGFHLFYHVVFLFILSLEFTYVILVHPYLLVHIGLT